jgi:hypothetical protein
MAPEAATGLNRPMRDDPIPKSTISADPAGGRHIVQHERQPHPCQHAYTSFRGRLLETLTRSKRSRLLNSIQPVAHAIFLAFDVFARWLMDICDTLIGSRGYVAIGSVAAAYFAILGLIDAKATQEETRASLERSLFITLVSSGNTASLVAAMKEFGPTQAMRVTDHPSWWFWN